MLLEDFLAYALRDEPWRDKAACKGVGNEIFFPKRGESRKRAKEMCKRCPVALECEDYAERSGSDYGMWNGKIRSPMKQGVAITPKPPESATLPPMDSAFDPGGRAGMVRPSNRKRGLDSY